MADNRGGPRQAAIGTHTPNRRDMQVPGAGISPSNLPKGQTYGNRVRQARSLAVTPAAGGQSASPTGSSNSPRQVLLAPGDVPSLGDPTANPNEPVTAGLPIGPGPGPEALNIPIVDSPELGIAHALFLEYPNSDIRRLIAFLEDSLQF